METNKTWYDIFGHTQEGIDQMKGDMECEFGCQIMQDLIDNYEVPVEKQKPIILEGRRAGCTCESEFHEAHTCPYSEEINDDSQSLCHCCPVCTQECADDI